MAKPSKKAPPKTDPDAEELGTLLDQLNNDPLAPVRAYMAQAGIEEAEARYFVYRIIEDGTKTDAFLFKCKPEDFDPEMLGRKYGSGTYRLKIYVKDADNPNGVIRGGGVFPIEMPAGYKPTPDAVNATPGLAAATGELGTFERLFLEMTRAANERTEKLLTAMAERANQPPANPLATLDGIKQIAEILKPAAAPVAPAADTFTTTLANMKALKELFPNADEGGGGGDGFAKGLGLVEKLLDRAPPPQAAAHAPNAAALPAPAAPAATGSQPAAPLTNEQEESLLMFKLQLRAVCRGFARGDSPADTAEDMYSLIPLADLAQMANAPDWFATLCGLVPDCANYQAQFTATRDALIKIAVEAGDLTGTAGAYIVAPDAAAEPGKST